MTAGAPAIDLAVEGTRADEWDAVVHAMPRWMLDDVDAQRVVVVAPHPDDESLGIGGTVAMLGRRLPVRVVAVTAGEAAPSRLSPAVLAARRQDELDEAVGRLVPRADIVRLWLADGAVTTMQDVLAERLATLIEPCDLVLSTLDGDGHPDHDATGRVAREVAAERGATHLWFPVWAWHWHDPQRSALRRGWRVDLDTPAIRAKAAAIAAHRSQVDGEEPVVPSRQVRRCLRPFEVVLPA